jgi:hypothetical protein
MPVPSGSVLPDEPVFATIPPDVYEVEIVDIEEEIKPSTFTHDVKHEDGSVTKEQNADTHQYKVKFAIKDPGQWFDRWISVWINQSLRPAKSGRPSLIGLLYAVTGRSFGPENKDEITGDFINSLMGSKLRITTTLETNAVTKKVFHKVTSFMPSKK